jgi:hypothetical protein
MKKIYQFAIAVTAVCLLAGCETTGLSPRESSGASYESYIMGLQPGSNEMPQKLSVPIRLAVAQVGETTPPENMLDKLANEKTLVASVTGLPLPGETYYHSQNVDYPARVKTICSLARTTGADFLFLFGGTLDSWQDNNSLSALDVTLVGGAIFPGTKIHIEGKAAGVLISTATCRPVFFINADARGTALCPDFFADGKTPALRSKVRDELVDKLNDQLINKLTDLSASAKIANY